MIARVRRWLWTAAAVLVAWWPFGLALASPEPGGEGEEHGGIELFGPIFGGNEADGKIGLGWIVINFLVLLLVLEKLLFSKLRARTKEKHDAIKSDLEHATEARSTAEALMREYQDRLARLDDEIAELQAAARAQAEKDRERIVADAQAEAEKIRKAARAAAERDAATRTREIESEILDRAVERAEATLRERFSESDERRMMDDYIGQIESTPLGGSK